MTEPKNVVPGKRAVIEALLHDVPAEALIISSACKPDGQLDEAVRIAERRRIPVERSDARTFERRFGDASRAGQGIALVVPPYRYAELGEVLSASSLSGDDGRALIVVCDHVTDAGNLGAVIRSAESVGASGVVIPAKRAAQVTSTTYKTSAGAVSHIPVSRVPNIARALDAMKDAGFWVVGCTEHAEDVVWDVDLAGRIALVMGNEEKGISELVLRSCDLTCKLPQMGDVSSLNVAQASTALMYEWLRQNTDGSCA